MESFPLDNHESVTLEQAQQEIARLQEFQQAAYSFLHVFCNYDIKGPLTKVLGYSDLMQAELLTKEQTRYLAAIQDNEQEISNTINTVLEAIMAERDRSTLKPPEPARIDLRPIITEAVGQAQQKIGYISELLADLQDNTSKENAVSVAHSIGPTDIKVHIPDDLPAVWSDSETTVTALRNVVRFMASHQSITDFAFDASFDAAQVTLSVSCAALDARERALEDFYQFETTQTFLTLGIQSLLLYNSWRALKAYDGQLQLDIQSPEMYGPSQTTVTITLPRCMG